MASGCLANVITSFSDWHALMPRRSAAASFVSSFMAASKRYGVVHIITRRTAAVPDMLWRRVHLIGLRWCHARLARLVFVECRDFCPVNPAAQFEHRLIVGAERAGNGEHAGTG